MEQRKIERKNERKKERKNEKKTTQIKFNLINTGKFVK